MGLSNLLERVDDAESLSGLSLAQNKAFLDVIILAVYADGIASEEEVAGIELELPKLPFVNDEETRDEVTQHGVQTRAFLEENVGNTDAIAEFAAGLADVVEDETHRLAALQMFAEICFTDGLAESEVAIAKLLGTAFGFDDSQVDTVLASVGEKD